MSIPLEKSIFKKVAKNLKTELSKSGFNLELPHGVVLNLLARSLGYKDYNTYNGLNSGLQDRDNYLTYIEARLLLDGMSEEHIKECIDYINSSGLPLFSKSIFIYIEDVKTIYNKKEIFYLDTFVALFFSYVVPFVELNQQGTFTVEVDINLDTLVVKERSILSKHIESLNFLDQEFLDTISKAINFPSRLISDAIDFAKLATKVCSINKNHRELLSKISKASDLGKGHVDINNIIAEVCERAESSEECSENLFNLLNNNEIPFNVNDNIYKIRIFDLYTKDNFSDMYLVSFNILAESMLS